MKERTSCQKPSLNSGMDSTQSVKCKIVVVGDSQCGKTALLHVFAKDCFPEVRFVFPYVVNGLVFGSLSAELTRLSKVNF